MRSVWLLIIGLGCLHAAEAEVQIEACKTGNIQSCYEAGLALTTGENAKIQDKKEMGLEYIRKACKYGEGKACDVLGENYFKEKHYQAAKPYLEAACNKGVRSACEGIGTIYRDGLETRQDDVKAREYYEKACELGGRDACINVAIIYRGGFGVEKNREMEKTYHKKACENGSEMGCKQYKKMDNEDKGIEEPGIWEKLKSLFN
mgnify:CR=1 FL=1